MAEAKLAARSPARKALGQHFLTDPRICARIAAAAGPLDTGTIIEIGPGRGSLTQALLKAGADEVIAIERDAVLVEFLLEQVKNADGKLRVLPGDARSFDLGILGRTPRRIVANLPYSIATKLLIDWLRMIHVATEAGAPSPFALMVLMFQSEVAHRIEARTGEKSYGRLAVLTQWLCRVEMMFDLRPGSFWPPPKVTSTLLRLTPRPEPLARASIDALEKVTACFFSRRRKMVRSGARLLFGDDANDILRRAGISPEDRAENIPIEGFCALARASVDLAASVPGS